MGYYGWFQVYVNSTTPVGRAQVEALVKYITENIETLDPQSVTAAYFDVEDDVLDADSFKLSEAEEKDVEAWFPKNLPGKLYKIAIEFKYPTIEDLKLLLDSAKACYQDASFIAGTMDDDEYNLGEMGITEEELIQFQKANLWVNPKFQEQKKPAKPAAKKAPTKVIRKTAAPAPAVKPAAVAANPEDNQCISFNKDGKTRCSRNRSKNSPVPTMCTQHGKMQQ